MKNPRNRTPLAQWQIEDAARLKAIFLRVQADRKRNGGEKITQATMADACGWDTQSAASQYINGGIPLNVPALLKASGYLGVTMAEILVEDKKIKHKDSKHHVTIKPDGYVISSGLPPDGTICVNFYQEGVEVVSESVTATADGSGSVVVSVGDGDTAPIRENLARLLLTPRMAQLLVGHLLEHSQTPSAGDEKK